MQKFQSVLVSSSVEIGWSLFRIPHLAHSLLNQFAHRFELGMVGAAEPFECGCFNSRDNGAGVFESAQCRLVVDPIPGSNCIDRQEYRQSLGKQIERGVLDADV